MISKTINFRPIDVIAIAVLAYMWILTGWNYSNADYGTYESIYNDIAYFGFSLKFEVGYVLLCKFAQFLGMNYQIFLIFIFGSLYLLLYIVISKYTKYKTTVLILYFLYPFFWDAVQQRNFIVEVLVLFSFQYLFNPKSYTKYAVLILLGTSIQKVSLFYILFLVPVYLREKAYKFSFLFIALGLLCLSLFLSTDLIYSDLFVNFISVEKLVYFQKQTSNRFFFVSIIYMLSMNLILRFCKNVNANKHRYIEYENVLLDANLLCLLIIPLLSLSIDFMRIYRNIFVLNYCYILDTIDGYKILGKKVVITKNEKKIVYGSYFIMLILLSFYAYTWLPASGGAILTTLNNNLIFSK